MGVLMFRSYGCDPLAFLTILVAPQFYSYQVDCYLRGDATPTSAAGI